MSTSVTKLDSKDTTPTSENVEQKLYNLAIQFGLVFLKNNFAPLKCSQLCQEYQARFRKNLTLRDHQCTRIDQLVQKLPVFEWDGELGNKTKVSLSRSLLIEFVFTPMLSLSPSKDVKEEHLPHFFKHVTGVNVELMYDILQIRKGSDNLLNTIVKHCSNFDIIHTPQGTCLSLRTMVHTSSPSGLGNSPIEKKHQSEKVSSDPPSIGPGDELLVDREQHYSTSSAQPLAKKVLLESPMYSYPHTKQPLLLPTPSIGILPPATGFTWQQDPRQVVRPGPKRSIIIGADPTQKTPIFRQQMNPDPRQTMSLDPRQVMGPDPRQSVDLDLRQTMVPDPRQAMGLDPRQVMGPDSRQTVDLDLRQTMFSDPRLATDLDQRQSRAPLIGPDHPIRLGTNTIQRQLIGSSIGPQPYARTTYPDAPSHVNIPHSSQHHLTPQADQHNLDQMSEKFPNPSVKLEDETFLPSHSKFRPDLALPKVSEEALALPSSTKKGGAKDSKEKLIAKVNSQVEEIIEDLSSKGKYLPLEAIDKVTKELVAKANRGVRIYNDKIHWRNIKAQENYAKLHGRVEELIKFFCWFTPITSLYELERALIAAENVESYEALHLGPLLKHPRVKDLFKPPDDLEIIPEMTTFKIQKHLMAFLSKRTRRAHGSKHSLEDFLEFLRTKEFQESINHLCIRISSFPLALQINFRFRASQTRSRQRMEAAIEEELQNMIQHETEKLKRKFILHNDEDPLSIRRNLSKKDPVQILESVFEACMNHFTGAQQVKVSSFMQSVTRTPVLRHLFLLSIYEGAYGADKLLPKFVEEEKSLSQMSSSRTMRQDVYYKAEGDVLKELLIHLRSASFPVDIASLARVEQRVVEKYGAPNFGSLGNDSFLHFLASHEKATNALGGKLIGSAFSVAHVSSMKYRIKGLVGQLKHDKRQDRDVVSKAIITHYSVDSLEDLGCGNMEKLTTDIQLLPTKPSAISYMSPILLNSITDTHHPQPSQRVGILGHQTPKDALACLRKAPLLEDLKEWSHWELVYQPQFGDLAEFLSQTIQTHSDCAVYALEISPGNLLRIDPNSSVSDFTNALDAKCPDPVSVAGYLVSLIVKRNSTQDISPQLLASHVTTSLEKMMVASYGSQTIFTAEQFVFHCLVRVPFGICKNIASELFIDPLRKVASSAAVDGLLKHCTSTKHRQLLQALGMSIGIKSWADDFKKMLEEADQIIVLFDDKSTSDSVALSRVHSSHDDRDNPQPADVEPSSDASTSTGETPAKVSIEALTSDPPLNDQTLTKEPATEEQLEEKEAECKRIIEEIRHNEFGIGIELDAKQQQFAEKQRLREGRGIKRLSLELYSKDTHFVLELIQNADDNNYHPHLMSATDASGDVPSLKFVINAKSIAVMNNEVGFSEKNIRAICDVGKSTKGAHRSGYIGQKGIGFKSVFRITDTPEIHSNGFHILFDASSDPIGFILPHWIQGNSQHIDLLQEEPMKWRTKIILPLKENHSTGSMTKKFSDIQPSLLLFLNRLRSITIDDQVCGNVRIMGRLDRDNGITEIAHSNGIRKETDRWLVVRRVLDKAKEFKPEVEATEIALALPLPSDLKFIPLSKDLQHQQVFAFLPLRSYGFRFIVQGDFDLPSSREDVNADSPWNQWLREEIPSLFLDTLQRIRGLPGIALMDAVALFLQFVPLEGELHDFFQPVTSQILNLLKGTDCLPSDPVPQNVPTSPTFGTLVASPLPSDAQNETILWKQPSQLLYVKEQFSFIREHIPQLLLMRSLNLSYLNSSLLSFVNPSLQYHLGIGNMTVDHLIEVMQAALKLYEDVIANNGSSYTMSDNEWSSSDDEGSDIEEYIPTKKVSSKDTRKAFITWVANWLACVHMIMEDTNDASTSTVEKLKLLPVIPMEDGTLSSIVEDSLFFPPDYNKGEQSDSSREFKEIYKEMKVVDMSLFLEGDDLNVQLRVRKMLELLGVKNLYPSEIIHFHILPQFKQGHWKWKSSNLLATYLVYIRECIEHRGYGISEPDMVRQLKDCVVLVTNRGPKLPNKDVIHFSSTYKCDPDLETLFPDVKWTTVSPVYLKKFQKRDDLLSWISFLSKLGVKKGLAVHQVVKELAEDSPQLNKLKEWRRLPAGALTIRDWESEELVHIMDSVSNKPSYDQQRQVMKRLAKLLDRNWDVEYKQYMMAQIFDGKNETYVDINDSSSIQQCLVQRAWLPSSVDNKTNTKGDKILYRGCELFDRVHKVQSILHTHVPYIGADLKSVDFVKLLGIRNSVSACELVEFVCKWSEHSSDSQVPFVTSIEHMRSVYLSLMQELQQSLALGGDESETIREKFQEENLIFVPNLYQEGSVSQDVPGHFHTIHNACWMDLSTVLYNKQKYNRPLPSNLPKVLQLHYQVIDDATKNRMIQQAFECFGVPETPRVVTIVTLLKYISSQSATPEPEHVNDFTNIASEFVRLCTRENNPIDPKFVYSHLKQAKVFPTHNRVWVSLEECLLEKDSDEIAKCFSENKQVHFLQWPAKPIRRTGQNRNAKAALEETKEEFARICKISKLSTMAKPRLDVSGETRPLNEVKGRLSLWISLIQKFIASSCKNQYKKLSLNNIQEKLSKLQVFSALSVKCRYFIQHQDSPIASIKSLESGCDFTDDEDIPTIYIAANKTEKLGCLLKALMKLFMDEAPEEERDAFERFLTHKLLLETPTTENEVQEIASELSIPSLNNGEQIWTIPLPVHKTVVQEESSSESEVESEGEEPLKSVTEQQNPEKDAGGLKSWPPRAAVDPSDSTHKTHLPGKDLPSSRNENKNTSTDAIGEKEINEARRKHLEDGEEESKVPPQVTQRIFPNIRTEQPDGAPPLTATQREFPPTTSSNECVQNEPRVSESVDYHRSHQGQHPPSNHSEVQKDKEDVQLTPTLESSHSSGNSKVTSTDEATVKEKRFSSKWHPYQQADSESLDLVDLQGLIQSVQSEMSGSPVVPFIDMHNNDSASLLEVGRWGEKFVFTLLNKIGHLPDGREFKSIVWMNETSESGKPYDIQVELSSSNDIIYIEVKSTAADKKELVAISWQEIKFAENHKKDYHVYRVYNAGKSTHRLGLRENLYEYLEGHPVRFFILL